MIVQPLLQDALGRPDARRRGRVGVLRGQQLAGHRYGRHAIELADRAMTSAVGIPVTSKATPISEGLFNALPNAGPWRLPDISRFGEPNTVGLPPNLVIGSVFKALRGRRTTLRGAARRRGPGQRHHRGRAAGHQLLRPDLAAVGGGQRGGRIAEQVFGSPLPDKPLEILREDAPTLCWSWQREPSRAKVTVIAGRHLPIARRR